MMMTNSKLKRIFNHVLCTRKTLLRFFPKHERIELEKLIEKSEKSHEGEIAYFIESGWDIGSILYGKTPRERALERFGLNKIWDTEKNSGVLIYISMADKTIEIVADRGINQYIENQDIWQKICSKIEAHFLNGEYIKGLETGLLMIEELLVKYLPQAGKDKVRNEISNIIKIH